MGVFPHIGIKNIIFVRVIRKINGGNPVIFALNIRRLKQTDFPLGWPRFTYIV
jgi:hypothetical protein